MINSNKKYGFTLIELMVAVIIIAVLAAVAVPQYKKAVLKSRFSKVMPVAKSIADAQEVYYLGNGGYAPQANQLDVEPITGGEITVALSETDGYDYVMTQSSKVPGTHYIMYQKHSENYPSEIHCEAEDDNTEAQWLCGSLSNNNSIGQTLTSGYTTYVIEGTGAGFAPGADEDDTDENGQVAVSCASAEAMGYTCNISTNEAGKQVKKICKKTGSEYICRITTYNGDRSYTSATCLANSNGVCGTYGYIYGYDANGKPTSYRHCITLKADGSACAMYYDSGNYDSTYDANGNMLTQRQCKSVDSSGNCTVYSSANSYDYTYDAKGNQLTKRTCSSFDSSGNCTAYSSSGNYDYTYDANGNKLTQRECSSVDNNGNCTAYSSITNYAYTYDENGNMLTQRYCSSVDNNGNCTVYLNSGINYTYNASGKMVRESSCSSVNSSSGKCTSYYATNSYTYTYDTNGNLATAKECATISNTGKCTSYKEAYRYVYDDNGKQIAKLECDFNNINTSTGVCQAYTSSMPVAN